MRTSTPDRDVARRRTEEDEEAITGSFSKKTPPKKTAVSHRWNHYTFKSVLAPIGPTHAGVVDHLNELLVSRLIGKAKVRTQNPIRLDRHTEPQPDLVVARLRPSHYTDRHPEGDEVLLVIEVADSSLRYDREAKLPLYAEAGIPEAWLVDVTARAITVHTESGAGGYAEEQALARGQEVVSSSVAGLRLSVDKIFEGLR